MLTLGEPSGGPLLLITIFFCVPTVVIIVLGKDHVFEFLAHRIEGCPIALQATRASDKLEEGGHTLTG